MSPTCKAAILAALLCAEVTAATRPAHADGDQAEKNKADRAGRWTLFPVISSAPETSLMLGGVAMYHFLLGRAAPPKGKKEARRSSAGLFAAYTLKNQFVLSVWPSVYLQGETWNVAGSLDASWFPDTLYATGRKSPEDSAEDFTQRTFGASLIGTRRVFRALRVGLQGMALHGALTEVEPGGLLDTDQIQGSDGGAAVGIGPTVLWDDRDQDMAPRTGSHVQLSAQGFHSALASDYDFVLLSFDARHYFPLPRQHVLAVQGFVLLGYGDVPFQAQAHLGGDSRLRGFFAGRYRDVHMIAAQVEYRLPLWWRIGGTAFAGTGDVAGTLGELDLLDLKFAGGLGLRLALNQKDRVNLRLDVAGTSEGDINFYLSLGEAF